MNLSEYNIQQKIRVQAYSNNEYYLNYKKNLFNIVNEKFKSKESKKILSALHFSESLEYFHNGLNKNQYLVHPLRIANSILESFEKISGDLLILALLHNILEVSKISTSEISNFFGKKISEFIVLLTVDRNRQWDKMYKKTYYEDINNAEEIVPIVKVFDKLDNIYLLSTNNNEKIRNMYISEIEEYVIPMAEKYVPSVSNILKCAADFSNKDGYISLDELLLKYSV